MKLDLLRAQKYNLGLLFFEFQCFVERDFYDFVLVSNNIAQNILLKLISGGRAPIESSIGRVVDTIVKGWSIDE